MKPKIPEHLVDTINHLPKKPGCYLMKDRQGQIFYIGKATRLNERVRSYFSGSDTRPFVAWLNDILFDLEFIVVNSPEEALVLERTLIQQHLPKYNIRLKDDANYIHLKLKRPNPKPDAKRRDRFPRFEFVRRTKNDGARYFGPFTSARVTRKTLAVVEQHFQIRSCRDHELENRVRPCLKYEIQQCSAPCVFDVEDYTQQLDQAVLLLEKKPEPLLENLRENMWHASEAQRYEQAGRIRDRIETIEEHFAQKHATDIQATSHIDVIAFKESHDLLFLSRLAFRDGRLVNSHRYTFERNAFEFQDQLEEALLEIYRPLIDDWPTKIYTREALSQDTEFYLNEMKPGRAQIKFEHPQRGQGRKLLRLAEQHVASQESHRLSKIGEREKSLRAVQKRLRLSTYPSVIECYDISTFQGTSTVASGIQFKDALPYKKGYRLYRIAPEHAGNDFDSLYEALSRRIERGLKEHDFPDLILIDGGQQQLNMVIKAADDLGFDWENGGTALRSIAKARAIIRTDDVHVDSDERIFFPGEAEPLLLKRGSRERHLLERVRDEAHRFAITAHRKIRSRKQKKSPLDEIEGIGIKKRKALLKHFGSLKAIQEASLETLQEAPGVGPVMAQAIVNAFEKATD